MLIDRLRRLWSTFIVYALKFGVVGMVGLVIDVGLYNLLRIGVFGDGFWQGAIAAKVISTSVAILFNWVGNRYWTFRAHRRQDTMVEFIEFVMVSVGGMGIAVACLWVSHYLLGFTSLLADNISTNVIGLFLGTAFRFVLYRYWVYRPDRVGALVDEPVEIGQRT